MTECIICKISSGQIPAYKVNEEKNCLAFLDIHPTCKGHTVCVHKTHASTVLEMDDAQLKELIIFVKKTMDKIKKVLNPDGFNVGWNHNSAGGQVVPHVHIHIFPRYNNDGGGSVHSIIKNPGNISVEEIARLFK